MAKSSEYTKACRRSLWFFRFLDFIFLILPVLIYVIVALSDGGILSNAKVAVVGSVIIALILTIFNIVAQKRLRCPIWIILIGLMIAIKNILPLIVILAIASVLDDFVFTPAIQFYKTKLIANKVVDERLGDSE